LIKQPAHRQCHSLGLISAGQPRGRRLDQDDNVGTVDCDHRDRIALQIIKV